MTADTPAASKDASTAEAVERAWARLSAAEQVYDHAGNPVFDYDTACSSVEYVMRAVRSSDLQTLWDHVATLTAKLEAERARQAEAEAEANEVGIAYGYANAQTEIADLTDRLTRETARADAAVAEAKALRATNDELLAACKLALNAFEKRHAIDWNVISDAIDRATLAQPAADGGK